MKRPASKSTAGFLFVPLQKCISSLFHILPNIHPEKVIIKHMVIGNTSVPFRIFFVNPEQTCRGNLGISNTHINSFKTVWNRTEV